MALSDAHSLKVRPSHLFPFISNVILSTAVHYVADEHVFDIKLAFIATHGLLFHARTLRRTERSNHTVYGALLAQFAGFSAVS